MAGPKAPLPDVPEPEDPPEIPEFGSATVQNMATEETAWRYINLQMAGYPEDIARVIAFRPDIDLHMAVELLLDGCDLKTAERILL